MFCEDARYGVLNAQRVKLESAYWLMETAQDKLALRRDEDRTFGKYGKFIEASGNKWGARLCGRAASSKMSSPEKPGGVAS